MMERVLFFLASLGSGATLVIMAIVGAIYYGMIFDSGGTIDKSLADVTTQLTTQKTKVQQSEKALQEIENTKVQLEALGEQYKLVSQQLPKDVRMAEVVGTVDVLSKTSKIKVKSKSPGEPIKQDIVEVIPLKVIMEGSFSQLTLFMYYIAGLERVMRLQNFTITLPDNDPRDADELLFDGQILSYRYIGDQAPPKGATE